MDDLIERAGKNWRLVVQQQPLKLPEQAAGAAMTRTVLPDREAAAIEGRGGVWSPAGARFARLSTMKRGKGETTEPGSSVLGFFVAASPSILAHGGREVATGV